MSERDLWAGGPWACLRGSCRPISRVSPNGQSPAAAPVPKTARNSYSGTTPSSFHARRKPGCRRSLAQNQGSVRIWPHSDEPRQGQ